MMAVATLLSIAAPVLTCFTCELVASYYVTLSSRLNPPFEMASLCAYLAIPIFQKNKKAGSVTVGIHDRNDGTGTKESDSLLADDEGDAVP